MPKDIVGVYFDFFGTLVDSHDAITNTWSRIAKRLDVDIDPNDPRIKTGLEKQYQEVDKLSKQIGKHYTEFTSVEHDFLNTFVLDELGVEREGSSEIINEEFENFFKEFHLNPGCRETLKQIKQKNIKIGLHTHAHRERAQLRMTELKIFEFFDIFIHTRDYGYNKSNIEIYEIALKAMQTTQPEKVLHVGDDPIMDVQMAQKVGMTPIFFNPNGLNPLDNVITISKLSDLLEYLY